MDIDKLAAQAGVAHAELGALFSARNAGDDVTVEVRRFAALVLEEAAKACDRAAPPHEWYDDQRAAGKTARACAAAIRALKPATGSRVDGNVVLPPAPTHFTT